MKLVVLGIMKYNFLVYFAFFTLCYTSIAQSNFAVLNEPYLEFNSTISNKYSLNFSLKERQFIYENKALQFKHRHIDFGHFSLLKLKNNASFGIGILYRSIGNFDNISNEFRVTEQFLIKGNKYNHRLRLDQRYLNTLTIHRFRYKLSKKLFLNSKKASITLANEALFSLCKASLKLENRIAMVFAYKSSENLEFSLGLEHRLYNYNHKASHTFVMLPSLIFKI